MPTNIETRAAKLAKKLEQLSALLRDQEIYSFLEREFSKNGTPPVTAFHAGSVAVSKNGHKKGDVVKAVAKACEQFNGKGSFKTTDVIEKMQMAGFVFEAKNPDIATNAALKRLVKKKKVEIVTAGKGRTPTEYRWLGLV